MDSITQLRKEVAKSIQKPDFLIHINNTLTYTEPTWSILQEIIFELLDCITDDILTQKRLQKLSHELNKRNELLQELLTGKQQLWCWVWISNLMQEWMKKADALELYEVSANLNNLMKIIFTFDDTKT